MIFYKKLIKELYIEKNDIALLASDLISLILYLKKKKQWVNPNDLIDAIINKLGKNGTLIVPSFNWDFCKGISYDIIKSRAQTGALANFILRKRTEFARTSHPIYSFLVYGKFKEILLNYNNTCGFDENSPFDFFFKKNIKLVSLGTPPSESFSIIHYFEQKANVEYRYVKKFKAYYIDQNNNSEYKTYSAFVRKLKYRKRRDYDKSFWQYLEKRKILFKSSYNKTPTSMVFAKDAGKVIYKDLLGARKYYPEKIKMY